ncbi:hypothetical protein PDJAM_G00215660 [Pangasius djambal]|uniref:Uncharacterized protein n=1 Tax=Pangasius djambal TaxID=1691987 RepID=A0ACC5YBQ6_9TELE|nr:hypothetical protein [Pangasius djambal]
MLHLLPQPISIIVGVEDQSYINSCLQKITYFFKNTIVYSISSLTGVTEHFYKEIHRRAFIQYTRDV